MNNYFALIGALVLFSCGQKNNSNSEKTVVDDSVELSESNNIQPNVYPALNTNWELGNRENLNVVLEMYKDWDELGVNKMEEQFADSVIIDMPDGNRNAGTKEMVIAKMEQFRNAYTHTHNQILSAIPMKNKETNIEWVNVMVYSKWTYKDNKKDSMLYYDLWRVRDGKINYLLSMEQTPSRMELKSIEKMAAPLNK